MGRLHQVISEKFHVEVSKNTVWRQLLEAGLTYQTPQREYDEADDNVRKKWRRYAVFIKYGPKIKHCILAVIL